MAKEMDMGDLKQLHNMWERFVHFTQNSDVSDMHPPAALWEAVQSITASNLQGANITPPSDRVFEGIAANGEMLWYFGNFCAQNGLYRSNLTPCKCNEVTDEGLKAFFDGVDFAKGDEDK